jgi:hypothetical protein
VGLERRRRTTTAVVNQRDPSGFEGFEVETFEPAALLLHPSNHSVESVGVGKLLEGVTKPAEVVGAAVTEAVHAGGATACAAPLTTDAAPDINSHAVTIAPTPQRIRPWAGVAEIDLIRVDADPTRAQATRQIPADA